MSYLTEHGPNYAPPAWVETLGGKDESWHNDAAARFTWGGTGRGDHHTELWVASSLEEEWELSRDIGGRRYLVCSVDPQGNPTDVCSTDDEGEARAAVDKLLAKAEGKSTEALLSLAWDYLRRSEPGRPREALELIEALAWRLKECAG